MDIITVVIVVSYYSVIYWVSNQIVNYFRDQDLYERRSVT